MVVPGVVVVGLVDVGSALPGAAPGGQGFATVAEVLLGVDVPFGVDVPLGVELLLVLDPIVVVLRTSVVQRSYFRASITLMIGSRNRPYFSSVA